MDRFDRIYRLHGILTAHRMPVPMTKIIEELECSQPTAERCIKDLRECLNAPLVYDRNRNGYFYNQHADKPYQLPGLWFSAEELNGLLICHQLLQNISPGLLSEQIEELLDIINKLLSLRNQPFIEPSRFFKIITIGRRLKDDANFKKVALALFNRKCIRMIYNARGDSAATTERTVSPHKLIYYRDNWYMAGFCHLKTELRIFAVDGIGSVKTLDAKADTIDEGVLDSFIGASYGIFSGPAEHTAVLEFTPERARWVADEQWHPQQQGEWLENGRYRLAIPFNDSRELIMDILKHGAEVEVIAPDFLRRTVIEKITAMQKIYKKNQNSLTE